MWCQILFSVTVLLALSSVVKYVLIFVVNATVGMCCVVNHWLNFNSGHVVNTIVQL